MPEVSISDLLAGISEAEVTTTTIKLRGLNIHVQMCGASGPALLMFNGAFAEVDLWKSLLPYLKGFRIIMFDPPGIGQSQLSLLPMNMFALAELGALVLDFLGIEKAHVLGVSFGGATAQTMALLHPRHVDSVVLVSTSYGGFAKPGKLKSFMHFVNPLSYKPGKIEKVAGDLFGGRFREEPELISSFDMNKPSSLRAAMYRMAPLMGWTSLPWLWAIRKPTLIIGGDDDPVTPLFNHKVIAKCIPNSHLHVVRDGGHMVLVDSPERVGPVISKFLREGIKAVKAIDAKKAEATKKAAAAQKAEAEAARKAAAAQKAEAETAKKAEAARTAQADATQSANAAKAAATTKDANAPQSEG